MRYTVYIMKKYIFAFTAISVGVLGFTYTSFTSAQATSPSVNLAVSPHTSPCQATVMTPGGQSLKNKVMTLPLSTELSVGPFLPTAKYSCTWSVFEGQAGTVDIVDARTGKSLISSWRKVNTKDGILQTKNQKWMEDISKTPVFFQSEVGAVLVPRYARAMKSFKVKIIYTENQSCDTKECGKPDTIEIPIRIDVKSALRAAAGEKKVASANPLAGTAWRIVGMYDTETNTCDLNKENKGQDPEDGLRPCDPVLPENMLSYEGIETAELSLSFSQKSTLSAKVCNIYNGEYTITKEGFITFSKVAGTKMACMEELGDIENGFLNLFEEEGGSVKMSTTKEGVLVLQNSFIKIELEKAK
jgi:hypothetical protein